MENYVQAGSIRGSGHCRIPINGGIAEHFGSRAEKHNLLDCNIRAELITHPEIEGHLNKAVGEGNNDFPINKVLIFTVRGETGLSPTYQIRSRCPGRLIGRNGEHQILCISRSVNIRGIGINVGRGLGVFPKHLLLRSPTICAIGPFHIGMGVPGVFGSGPIIDEQPKCGSVIFAAIRAGLRLTGRGGYAHHPVLREAGHRLRSHHLVAPG